MVVRRTVSASRLATAAREAGCGWFSICGPSPISSCGPSNHSGPCSCSKAEDFAAAFYSSSRWLPRNHRFWMVQREMKRRRVTDAATSVDVDSLPASLHAATTTAV